MNLQMQMFGSQSQEVDAGAIGAAAGTEIISFKVTADLYGMVTSSVDVDYWFYNNSE